MEKSKSPISKLIVCACEVAVGVVLFINPEGFTKIVVTGLGILLCVLGAVALINYFRMSPEEASLSQELTRGILALLLGVFCIYKSEWIMKTFLPIIVLYGVACLVVGVMKLQWTVDMIRMGMTRWVPTAIAAALSIIAGLVIVLSPSKSMWTFLAVALIVTGVADLVSAIMGGKISKSE